MLETSIFFPTSDDSTRLINFHIPWRDTMLSIGDDGSVVCLELPSPNQLANPAQDLFERLRYLKERSIHQPLTGSDAPSDVAFQNARDFVLSLPLTQIPKPTIHLANDGEVNFQWAGQDYLIDLGFYGNEQFSFFAKKDGFEPLLADGLPVTEGIPAALITMAAA
jgi:hypothetical protein